MEKVKFVGHIFPTIGKMQLFQSIGESDKNDAQSERRNALSPLVRIGTQQERDAQNEQRDDVFSDFFLIEKKQHWHIEIGKHAKHLMIQFGIDRIAGVIVEFCSKHIVKNRKQDDGNYYFISAKTVDQPINDWDTDVEHNFHFHSPQ